MGEGRRGILVGLRSRRNGVDVCLVDVDVPAVNMADVNVADVGWRTYKKAVCRGAEGG